MPDEVRSRAGTLDVRVRCVQDEAFEIKRYELASVDGSLLPAAMPGGHIDVNTGGGTIRQYSLCNGPLETNSYIIAVKREPASRGGSQALHETVRVGDVLAISAPRDNFTLVQEARSYLLLAGGIGITPLISMAKYLVARNKPFELAYFAQSERHVAFRSLLLTEPFQGKARLKLGNSVAETQEQLASLLASAVEGRHVYICGPGPFMAAAIAAANDSGWRNENVHVEYFSAAPLEIDESDPTFTIELQRCGLTTSVRPDETIVQALARVGISVDVSCEQGICGACLTKVIDGVPDHRDSYLTDQEKDAGDQMCLCVSRARSAKLVLDI